MQNIATTPFILRALAVALLGTVLPVAAAADDGAADQRAVVRFVSPDGALWLSVAGQKARKIRRGGTLTFRVKRAPLHYVVSSGTASSGTAWRYTAELDLHQVRRRTVTLKIPGMHLRVINRSDEPRTITAGKRHFGILKRGASATYGPIRPGVAYIKSVGLRSRTHIASIIANRPGGFQTVVLSPIATGLVVPNPINTAVRARIDNRDYGIIEPRQQVRILGLAPGYHQVELVDVRTGRPYTYDAEVHQRAHKAPTIGSITLRVDNRTGETLTLPAALGGIFDRPVLPGESVDMTLPVKRFQFRLHGKDSGLTYRRDIDPGLGARQTWWLKRPHGTLILRNGTGEPARVIIGKFGTVTLPRDAKVEVRKVPAGRMQLVIETETSKARFTRGIALRPGGDLMWTVTAGRSVLVIHNGWAEPVDLAIDGSPRGRVQAQSTFRVTAISPGVHEVVAQTIVSKVREVVRVQVLDGVRTRLRLTPPRASVRLHNTGREPLAVIVRGRQRGVVAPGKSSTFSVASGRMAVEVRTVGAHLSVDWLGTLAPAQQMILPNPVRGAAPIIIDNPLTVPITIRVGARAPLIVEPGERGTIADLGVGAHLVELHGRGFVMRQRVLVQRNVPPIVIKMPK